jgi:hypothetical protein
MRGDGEALMVAACSPLLHCSARQSEFVADKGMDGDVHDMGLLLPVDSGFAGGRRDYAPR